MSGTWTAMARAERAELADFLTTLTAEEWDAPSLCTGWRVRDVVAHMLSYEELSTVGLVRRLSKGPGGANAAGVAEMGDPGPDELVAFVRGHLEPRGFTAFFGGRIALTDGMIHHQDIRRPLGRPREIPAERLRVVLEFAAFAPPIKAKPRIKGLGLHAPDVGWRKGDGPLVEGPGEALLMAIAGRACALPELSGPGLPTLTSRLT
jgi:uncharacterized protein (TIGR03083 family)